MNRAFKRRWKTLAVAAIGVIGIGASLWGWRNLCTSNRQSAVSVAPTSQQRAADAIEPTSGKQEPGDTTTSVAKVDPKRVEELAAALNSGGVDEQIEAINLFSKVGTAEQKAAIVAKAENRDRGQCSHRSSDARRSRRDTACTCCTGSESLYQDPQ